MPGKVPTTIRGVTYPSMTAAAKALGVGVSTIQRALEEGRTDTVGLWRSAGKPRPVEYLGNSYPSLAAAARATGHPVSTVYGRLRKPYANRRRPRRKKVQDYLW